MPEWGFALLGLGFWLGIIIIVVNGVKHRKKKREQPNGEFRVSTHRDISDLGVSITSTLSPDLPPKEILQDMRKSYTLAQAKNDIRILKDCLNLIETTKNLDTFVSRADLGMRTALTLRQAEQAKIRGIQDTQKLVDSFFAAVYSQKERILKESFEQEKEKISLLSTPRGKSNRWKKYLEVLQKYKDEFDVDNLELYDWTVKFVQERI